MLTITIPNRQMEILRGLVEETSFLQKRMKVLKKTTTKTLSEKIVTRYARDALQQGLILIVLTKNVISGIMRVLVLVYVWKNLK